MNSATLEEILSCPTLPSLPAVAVRVIELSNDSNVAIDQLAKTIQNDQALASKVLRTVNSSFYGLRRTCTTINQAIIILGMNAVESLALGFSLVSTLSEDSDEAFDYTAYWRRQVYTAVAAKSIAHASGAADEDEAFLGGLLQDVGMMAMLQALGQRYRDVVAMADGDHRRLIRHELAELDVQHPEIGAMLAQRWKLPPVLVMPVRYHECPSAAPAEHRGIVRCVAAGNIAHDVLVGDEPAASLRRFHQRCRDWFGLGFEAIEQTVRSIGISADEVAGLFQLDLGEHPSTDEVLDQANARLLELSFSAQPEERRSDDLSYLLLDGDRVDALTGLPLADAFTEVLNEAFLRAGTEQDSLSTVHVRIDSGGSAASDGSADGLIIGVVTGLRKIFEPAGGVIGRLASDRFGVILPGMSRIAALKAAEQFRGEIPRASQVWKLPAGSARVTCSLGVATLESESRLVFTEAAALLSASERAADAAHRSGGDRVFAHSVRSAA